MSIKKSPRKWSFLEITNFSDIGTMLLPIVGFTLKKGVSIVGRSVETQFDHNPLVDRWRYFSQLVLMSFIPNTCLYVIACMSILLISKINFQSRFFADILRKKSIFFRTASYAILQEKKLCFKQAIIMTPALLQSLYKCYELTML